MTGVGVVIPLYNHERYIVQAIESVLGQRGDIDLRRVVVIDDGSSDGSLEEARKVRDRRVEVTGQDNAGAHATINRGVSLLPDDCELVAILNSDDRYLPDRLSRCTQVFRETPSAQMVVTALEMVDDAGSWLPETHGRAVWYRAVRSLLDRNDLGMPGRLGVANFAVTTSNIVARRDWLVAHPFRDYRYVHDYRCLLDAAIEGVLEAVDEPHMEYRVHSSNTIDESVERIVREMLRMHLEFLADWAPRITTDRIARDRFAEYQRMSWWNVSSLRQDVAHSLLAQLLADAPDRWIAEHLDALNTATYPELAQYPNRRLITPDGRLMGPTDAAGLADRLAREETRRREETAARKRFKEADALHRLALRSRWMALGRLLGLAPKLHRAERDDTPAYTEQLRDSIASSRWVRTGAALGSRTCRELLGKAAAK